MMSERLAVMGSWLAAVGAAFVIQSVGASGSGAILVVGDSLSAAYGMNPREGWVSLLENRLRDRQMNYTVANASISGDTTAGGAARLSRLLQTHRPRVVVIELGGNDGLRGLPLDQIRKNLNALVAEAKRANARVLLVGVPLPPNYGPRYTGEFTKLFLQIADQQRVAHLPSILEGVGGNPALMQADGIHPNARAQAKLLENVWSKLETLL